jgi:hypothetical protein
MPRKYGPGFAKETKTGFPIIGRHIDFRKSDPGELAAANERKGRGLERVDSCLLNISDICQFMGEGSPSALLFAFL